MIQANGNPVGTRLIQRTGGGMVQASGNHGEHTADLWHIHALHSAVYAKYFFDMVLVDRLREPGDMQSRLEGKTRS